MSIIRPRTLIKSFGFALQGLIRAFQEEQNFRLQVAAAVVVLVLIVVFQVRLIEAAILILVVMAVLVIELMNTIFEAMLDLLKPRLNHYAAIVKDLMAAAVFLSSLGAVLVGIIILLPYFMGAKP